MIDFLAKIKSEPPVKKKWREVYNSMSPHTQGVCPVNIFTERRPLESENENILAYRKRNFRPITKGEYDRAISDYLQVANSLDVKIDWNGSDVEQYEEQILLKDGFKKIDLDDWVINKIGAYRQTDPNSVIVILPKHPTEEFMPSYEYELPNFNNVLNLKVDVDVRLITHDNIVYADPDAFLFKGGDWVYGKKDHEHNVFYWGVTKERTYIIYPERDGDKMVYKQVEYYSNLLSVTPVVGIAGMMITESDGNGNTYDYYISDYYGATAWGDLAIGQGSDLQICEVRFTYPRHWKIQLPCDNEFNGCHLDLKLNKYMTSDSEVCTRCQGTGFIQDNSPAGTITIPKGGTLFGEDGKFQEPEGFIAPPEGILQHSADRHEHYLQMMRSQLNILSQNLTNQSGESKSYDVQHKVATNMRIVTSIYTVYLAVLNIIDEYRGGSGNITITFPEDFDVTNANDILIEISEAKKNSLPYMVIVELTKKYMLKKFGKSDINEYIVDFLSVYDTLFAYSLDDMATVKGVFGSDITPQQIALHANGYQLLRQMAQADEEAFLKRSFEEVQSALDVELAKLINIQSL